MREGAEYSIEERGSGGVEGRFLVLHGVLLVSTIGELDAELRGLGGTFDGVDLSGTGQMDTVGAWMVSRFATDHSARIIGGSAQASILLDAVRGSASEAEITPARAPIFTRVAGGVGDKVFELAGGIRRVVGFLGAILVSIGRVLTHPSRIRWLAIVRQMELVGVTALPIVGLMSFLIGIVIAQQGSAQLSQFGAETLTVNLVGRLTLRELGVLMTAIMVAGRSGSAFAAQLGTMKLTEEIDAMRTIGVSPMEALILPRIIAVVLMMVLLSFFGAVMGVIGGAVISHISLGIPFLTFLARVQEVVPIHDLYVGTIKAPVFGLIIALTGCYQGMRVTGNAEQVGIRTTKAVVQAIFLVIVIDAFFAVFFTAIGWG